MILSTKTTIKFANSKRKKELFLFLTEYSRICQVFVNILWDIDHSPTLLPKNITEKVKTWLSARMVQCAGKQARGIVYGMRKKHKQRSFVLEQLKKNRLLEDAEKLQKVIDKHPLSKPILQNVEPELDSRFVKVDWENTTSFDGWITVTSIGAKKKILMPVKKTRHFNKLAVLGKIKSGLRLSKKNVTFSFEIPEVENKSKGETLGIDLGINNLFYCSDGQKEVADIHNHTFHSIIKKLERKKKGSRGFQRAQNHRKNFVNWSINRLNLKGVKEIKRENLYRISAKNRFLSHWAYADIIGKLDSFCERQGVLVSKIDPAYTSQKCSECGKVEKSNRRNQEYKCSCGHTAHADSNASQVILNSRSL